MLCCVPCHRLHRSVWTLGLSPGSGPTDVKTETRECQGQCQCHSVVHVALACLAVGPAEVGGCVADVGGRIGLVVDSNVGRLV